MLHGSGIHILMYLYIYIYILGSIVLFSGVAEGQVYPEVRGGQVSCTALSILKKLAVIEPVPMKQVSSGSRCMYMCWNLIIRNFCPNKLQLQSR